MNNPRISLGIIAYNEENNIKKVLKNILSQRQTGWQLSEILVYCDGCTDKTILKIQEIKSDFITIIDDPIRRGKTYRLSQLFKKFSGDLLVMYDADIEIEDHNVTTTLIQAFKDRGVMLVGGNSMPFTPITFFEKAVYTTFEVFYKSRKYIKGGNNVFGCTGSILAIRKNLARAIKLPKIFNEDVFIYLYCIKNNYKFKYVDEARVFYKLPTNIFDYVKQIFRSDPRAATFELKKYFGNKVEEEFYRPKRFYIKSIFESFLKNPIGLSLVVAINIVCKLLVPVVTKKYKLEWFTAQSTH